MDQHHYLGFKRFSDRGQRYVFEWGRTYEWNGKVS